MKLYPVVHIGPKNALTSIREGKKALDMGADGIFIINHYGGIEEVFFVVGAIRSFYKDKDCFIGINLLGASTDDALRWIVAQGAIDESRIPQALWVDDVMDSGEMNSPEKVYRNKQKSDVLSQVQLFGGIAHKASSTYDEAPDFVLCTVAALNGVVDVITTSGAGTGIAPSVEKMQAVSEGAYGKPIALASGVTAENLPSFAFVDYVLVSSSIETSPGSGVFDDEKLGELIKIVRDINLNN